MNIIKEQKKKYQSNFLKNGSSPKGMLWNNIETQYLRFEILLKNLLAQKTDFSIHDVGAGICDLHEYLIINNIKHIYSGTEIVDEMIEYSNKKFPQIKLYNRNLLVTAMLI
jgi:hypothetical protein